MHCRIVGAVCVSAVVIARGFLSARAYEAVATDNDPYGLPTVTADSGGLGSAQNPYGFAGGIQDRTTDWTHFGNRYYDATTGTWTQRDTLDKPLSPLDANRYAYAGGDPINNNDPNGQDVGCLADAGQVGAFVGGGIVAIGAGALAATPTVGLGVLPAAGLGAVAGGAVGGLIGVGIGLATC